MTNKVIKGKECRFAIHIPSYHPDIPDVHLIKEQVHYEDGTIEPKLSFVKNFQRAFWITKKNKQNHEQKKEAESLDNVLKVKATQSGLRNAVAKALDKQWSKDSLKQLCSSPYIYGTDLSSTAIIKKIYMDKYPNLVTKFNTAFFDTETDVLNGTEDIIMATIVYQDKIFLSVDRNFIKGIANAEELFRNKVNKYIQEYIDKHNFKIEFYIADGVVGVIKAIFNKAHEWKPDFLAIWNMDFDIPKVLSGLEKNHIDPKDVLCDPSVPNEYRICKYKQGAKKKTTASGVVKPISPAAQWHTLLCTSSFYVIDAMCAYKHIRLSEQEESSYSLDNILNKRLGIRKLKFEEANQYNGLKWHQFMQTEYKLEYMVYNIFDCVSMLELDEVTKDLAYTLPAFSYISDFSDFKSNPKRIVDALSIFFLEKGYVIGSAGYTPRAPIEVIEDEEADEEYDTLGLKNWIVTLPSHMTILGLNCIAEDPTIKTNIRCFVYDSDSVSAYPTCISTANVSKATTKREIIDIVGIEPELFKKQNLNIILGNSNAIEYCNAMYNMPKPQDLLTLFNNSNI